MGADEDGFAPVLHWKATTAEAGRYQPDSTCDRHKWQQSESERGQQAQVQRNLEKQPTAVNRNRVEPAVPIASGRPCCTRNLREAGI